MECLLSTDARLTHCQNDRQLNITAAQSQTRPSLSRRSRAGSARGLDDARVALSDPASAVLADRDLRESLLEAISNLLIDLLILELHLN